MKVELTYGECRALYDLLDNIEYAKHPDGVPIPVDSKFRYTRNYNLERFARINDQLKDKMSLAEPHYSRYKEYNTKLNELQEKFKDLELEKVEAKSPSLDPNELMSKAQSEFKILSEKYKDIIDLITEKSKFYQQKVDLELRAFRLSFMTDLSNSKKNDAFMYHFQKIGLIVDDTSDSEEK